MIDNRWNEAIVFHHGRAWFSINGTSLPERLQHYIPGWIKMAFSNVYNWTACLFLGHDHVEIIGECSHCMYRPSDEYFQVKQHHLHRDADEAWLEDQRMVEVYSGQVVVETPYEVITAKCNECGWWGSVQKSYYYARCQLKAHAIHQHPDLCGAWPITDDPIFRRDVTKLLADPRIKHTGLWEEDVVRDVEALLSQDKP